MLLRFAKPASTVWPGKAVKKTLVVTLLSSELFPNRGADPESTSLTAHRHVANARFATRTHGWKRRENSPPVAVATTNCVRWWRR